MLQAELLDRFASLVGDLPAEERPQGERMLALARELESRERQDGRLVAAAADAELRRELGRLVELLSRRSARGIVFGKLGRLLLAELSGDLGTARMLANECDAQLGAMGF